MNELAFRNLLWNTIRAGVGPSQFRDGDLLTAVDDIVRNVPPEWFVASAPRPTPAPDSSGPTVVDGLLGYNRIDLRYTILQTPEAGARWLALDPLNRELFRGTWTSDREMVLKEPQLKERV